MRRLAIVVEGHGEVEAAPILVRRVGAALATPIVPHTPKPIRIPKGKLLKTAELHRAVRLAVLNAGDCGAVLVLLDADNQCPASLGPQLVAEARAAAGTTPVAVVLANKEFECWFIAAVESLSGQRGLAQNVASPADPESIGGAKGWLERHMETPYSETLDQPAFAASMDLLAARRADSFDKFWREVVRLLDHLSTCN